MVEDSADGGAGPSSRPQFIARYQLDDDGVAWTIHIETPAGDFAATATRLTDIETRACQTIQAVLGLRADAYDLQLVHVLNLEKRTPKP
jgi:hypothetical protein